jgi:hypothetical protein
MNKTCNNCIHNIQCNIDLAVNCTLNNLVDWEQNKMKKEIQLLKNMDLSTIFDSSLDPVLKQIEKEVLAFVPDVSTDKGRKEIKAIAYKVTRSKTAIDNAGKELNAEIKAKAKLIDSSRKSAREFLDELAKKVRLPLTEYEEAQEAKKEIEEINLLHIEAIELNVLHDREKAVAEKERIAQEKEEELKLEQEQLERDNEIRGEQKAKIELAKQQAIDAEKRAIQAEKDKQKLIKQQAEDKIARDKQAKIDANNKTKAEKILTETTEKLRIEAARQAEIDKQKAIKAEEQRLKKVKADKDAKAKANLDNVKKKNNDALNSLILEGVEADIAKAVVILIAQGKVSWVEINY